ncbi:TPA: hypothetical protein ACM6ZP_005050, partial [Escherichia coli]
FLWEILNEERHNSTPPSTTTDGIVKTSKYQSDYDCHAEKNTAHGRQPVKNNTVYYARNE